ncbi:MAG: hypothetical protein AAF485_25990 [Chloroflexota bacterium]
MMLDDLDRDGEAEIIIIVSLAGASCCTTLSIAYFDEPTQSYITTDDLWRKYTLGFDMIDLNRDGVIEFRTLNESFNSALGGASIVSFFSPLQIFSYSDGQLVEVTAQFPELVDDHAQHWRTDEELFCDIYAAGAYLAEMYLLNKGEQGWQILEEACTLPQEDIKRIEDALQSFNYAP